MVMPMNLSPDFQKVLRGYRAEEVDEFVAQISTAYEQVRRESFAAKEEAEKLKKQLEYFQALESSLNKALVAAQQKAEEIINGAHDEVNRSLAESKSRLDNINTEIAQKLAGTAEKARQIEDDAHRRAEEIMLQVRDKVANETSRYAELGAKMTQSKQELIRVLNGFLLELQGTEPGGDSIEPENSGEDSDPVPR